MSQLAQVRLFVYNHFVSECRAPGLAEIATALEMPPGRVRAILGELADDHMLVLQPGTAELWMAMPFSAVRTAYRVSSGRSAWWANCAWDALGVPAMLNEDAVIHTQCPVSEEPFELRIVSGQPEAGVASLVHFAVPALRWWEDIGYT